MAKHVKGVIFLDYLRMIKKYKHLDWDKHLEPEDLKLLDQMILPSQWYPLESYQRMGLAVFHEFANQDVEAVRKWGRASMDEMVKVYKILVEKGDPLRSLNKYNQLRSRFFDFEGIKIEPRSDKSVHIKVDLAFEGVAEEAYALQTLGGFERLLELSGAKNIKHEFQKRAWEGDGETVIDISWE